MKRILLVDDEEINLDLLRIWLPANFDCVVDCATNGEEALEKARVLPPDIIVSDLFMPVMDGFALLKQWKQEEGLKQIPFMVYTATYTETEDRRLAADLGADAFLLKPSDPNEFLVRLRGLLEGSSTAKTPVRPGAGDDDNQVLKQYSERLSHKLDSKARQIAEATRESDRRLTTLISNLPGYVYRVANDLDFTPVFISDGVEGITGYSVQDYLVTRCITFGTGMHPEDRLSVWQQIQKALAAHQPYECEYRIRTKSGETRWVWRRGRGIFTPDGRLQFLEGFVTDITSRRDAEQHSRQLNRTYRMLTNINQFIVRERNQQAILDNACRLAVEQVGFRLAWIGLWEGPPSSNIVRLAAFAGASPEIVQVLNTIANTPSMRCAFITRAMESGRHAVCNDIAGDPESFSWRSTALERGYRSLASFPLIVSGRKFGILTLYSAETGFFDADELRLLDELADDIAFALENSELEEKLRESEARFRQLAENIREGLWLADPSRNTLLYLSPACEAIWGQTCASLQKNPDLWMKSIHPDDIERVRLAASTLRDRGTYNEVYRIVRQDGSIRWIRDKAFPVRNDAGEIYRIAGVAEDITERRQEQERLRQAQKMEALGTLAGGVAHGFNNMLGTILGNAELAKLDIEEDHPVSDCLREIIQCGLRARDLVQRIVTFSSPQEHRLRLLKLHPVLEDAVKLLTASLPPNVVIQYECSRPDLQLRADNSQIHQVLLNLVTNAWHSMEGRPGRINIQLDAVELGADFCARHTELAPGPHARLRVIDSGAGMNPATLERIFEPFYTTKPQGQGTGLGLSVVHGIVRGHGGIITVESAPGIGSTFTVLFPLPVPSGSPSGTDSLAGTSPSGGGQHILFIDDETQLVSIANRLLDRMGFKVTAVTRARDGLEKFRSTPEIFDIVITDHNMPEMTGVELARQLRQIRPGIPIILASGNLRPHELEAAQSVGINAIVAKPVSREELTATLQRLLAARPAG